MQKLANYVYGIKTNFSVPGRKDHIITITMLHEKFQIIKSTF